MHDLHFGSLDLNLLRVLDALLQERSVTRAGTRLGLTQSAVSHALSRLRYALGDELFIRSASGMQPTVRALEIGPAVHAALLQLHTALAVSDFEPALTERSFTVLAGPYACAVLIPALVGRLRAEAPLSSLRIGSVGSRLIEPLDSGRADVAIGGFDGAPERFAYEPIIGETLVWVVRAGHPAAGGRISLKTLAEIPHVLIGALPGQGAADADGAGGEAGLRRRSSWEDSGVLDRTLAAQGLSRRIGVIAPDSFSALAIASRTDMAALLPARLAEISIQAGRVVLLRTPYVSPPVEIGLLYRRDRATDPAQAWFLDLVREAAAAL